MLDRIVGVMLKDKRVVFFSHRDVLAGVGKQESCVEHRDQTLVVLSFPIQSSFKVKLESLVAIYGKVLIVFSVGCIEPDAVKRDLVRSVLLKVGRDISERLVAKRGHVPAESPEGWKARLASNILVSSNYLLGSSLHEEVCMNLTADSDVAQDSFSVILVSDNRRHCVRVAEPDTHILTGSVTSLNEREGMHAIRLLHTLTIIILGVLTVCPHGPRALTQLEFARSLTEAKNIL